MMAAIPFDRTRQRVQQQFDEGLFTRGAQIAIEVGGECVLDAVIGDNGLGEPMSSVHLFRVYCTIKPIAALAVGRLLD